MVTVCTSERVADEEVGCGLEARVGKMEAEVLELKKLLEAETRRANMLEGELSLALAASSRAEQAHQAEVVGMEADVMKAAAERQSLLEKLQEIETVEDAIRDIYVQMKDRIAEDEPNPRRLEQVPTIAFY
eukprot:evm.model.scf_638.7 EVM.evm.TU.scf_638.7   scf_638:59957-61199(-)